MPKRMQMRQPIRAPRISMMRLMISSPSEKRRGERRMTLVVPKSSNLVSRVSMAKLSIVMRESMPISLTASMRCLIFLRSMWLTLKMIRST